MAKTLTSRLVMEVIDRVTGPARAMSKSILGIGDAVRGANGARGGFADRLGAAINRNNASLDAARGRLVDVIGGAYALNAALGGPVRQAMRFEDAMADVRKVVDFDTPEALKAFEEGLIGISRRVPIAVEGLAAIAAAAGQAGIAQEDLLRFTEQAAITATAFDISAEEAGDSMAKLMTGMGLTLDQAVSLTDAMNHLSNAQASSASQIMDVVQRVGPQAKMFGMTAEEVAAFASAMVSAGFESDVAATSINNMGKALTRGASATNRQKAAYKALGMDAEKVAKSMQEDAVGTTLAVIDAIGRLPAEQRAALASDLFGDEARALGPLLTNTDLLRQSLGLVGDEAAYAESTTKEFAARSKTASANMQRFRNRLAAVGITLGTALLPALTDLLDLAGPIIDRIGAWIEANSKLAAGLAIAAGALVAFRLAAAALSYAGLLGRGGVLSMLSFGMSTVGAAGGKIWGAVRSSIALQSALAAMDGAKIGLFGKLAAGLRGLAAVTGLSAVASGITAVGAVIAGISAPVWLAIAAAVAAVGLAWKYWDRVSSFVSGVGQAIGEILQPALEAARPILDWFAPLGEAIAAGWQKAKDAVAAVGEWFGSFFTQETLTEEDKAAAQQAGYDFVMAIWEGMKSVAASVTAWVTDTVGGWVQTAVDGLNSLAETAIENGIGYRADKPAGAPDRSAVIKGQRAKGGPVSRGGTYLVGEEGPELITASRSGYVNPNTGGGTGGGVTVNNNIVVQAVRGEDAESLTHRIVREIEERTRAAMRGLQADAGLSTY